jgi:hypothetical protein
MCFRVTARVHDVTVLTLSTEGLYCVNSVSYCSAQQVVLVAVD